METNCFLWLFLIPSINSTMTLKNLNIHFHDISLGMNGSKPMEKNSKYKYHQDFYNETKFYDGSEEELRQLILKYLLSNSNNKGNYKNVSFDSIDKNNSTVISGSKFYVIENATTNHRNLKIIDILPPTDFRFLDNDFNPTKHPAKNDKKKLKSNSEDSNRKSNFEGSYFSFYENIKLPDYFEDFQRPHFTKSTSYQNLIHQNYNKALKETERTIETQNNSLCKIIDNSEREEIQEEIKKNSFCDVKFNTKSCLKNFRQNEVFKIEIKIFCNASQSITSILDISNSTNANFVDEM